MFELENQCTTVKKVLHKHALLGSELLQLSCQALCQAEEHLDGRAFQSDNKNHDRKARSSEWCRQANLVSFMVDASTAVALHSGCRLLQDTIELAPGTYVLALG